jgi:nitrogenase molybdenum-iron protein NifN
MSALSVVESKGSFVSTRNACKLCAPLGACVALRGIEGCIPLIHGSQGCATYIRRYTISHFREPVDIASSNFVESTAIFGGRDNLFTALDNVSRSYKPAAIGVTSTCLSETIGENVPLYLKQYEDERKRGMRNNAGQRPVVFYASTPSYRGTHMDGFHEALLAAVTKMNSDGGDADDARVTENTGRINLISGFVSTEDIRELRDIMGFFCGDNYILLPDYSDTLDGVSWETYQKLPEGGAKTADIARMGGAAATVCLGNPPANNAGSWLLGNRGVPLFTRDLPIGIENTDRFCDILANLTGWELPGELRRQRGRLVDAYIDGHKYVNGKRAVIYGEEDFVASLASFLDEIGVIPVIAATGAASAGFKSCVRAAVRNCKSGIEAADNADFAALLEMAKDAEPDFIMGNSKGLYLSRALGVPLLRCGFPVHDRIGGQRILHLGYRGALHLFDAVCNCLLEAKQSRHEVGYTYL